MEDKNPQGSAPRLMTLEELEAVRRREQRLASKRAYRKRHKAKVSARKREWRINNLDKERARTKRYRKAHPTRAAMHRMARRARKRLADVGDVDVAWLHALRIAQDDRCISCEVELNGGGELDHLIPLARGGLHARCNVAFMCRPCNRAKGAGPVEQTVSPEARWRHLMNWARASKLCQGDGAAATKGSNSEHDRCEGSSSISHGRCRDEE